MPSHIDYSILDRNEDRYLRWLADLVAYPSVSLPNFDQAPIKECGSHVAKILREVGMESIEIIEVDSSKRPYIYADYLHAPGQPTILFYAHYDVQPIGDQSQWESSPFELTEREGRLYGRGSADDKGGLVAQLAALDVCLRAWGTLPINVKILFEGEEEIGSPNLDEFIKKYGSKIKADAIVIVDAENFDVDQAGLTVSLRGVVAASVEVKTLKQPLHSGLWGGSIPDAAIALSKMLGSLVDEQGVIQVPGLLEMVRPMTETEREKLAALPFDGDKFKREAGLLEGTSLLNSEAQVRENNWFKPHLSVNAVQASARSQAGNILVEGAWAKIGLRTVPNMDGEKTFELIQKFLDSKTPFGLKADIRLLSAGNWWRTKTDAPVFSRMEEALGFGWKKPAVQIGCGASIPFVQTFSEALDGAPVLLLGVADPLTLAHSENESMSREGWRSTIRSLIRFIELTAH